ncbi:MAG: hypothetical protein QXN68_03965 [Thermoplasmata archaeon]
MGEIVSFTLQKNKDSMTTSITSIRDDVPYPVVPPEPIGGVPIADIGVIYSIKYNNIYKTITYVKLLPYDLQEKLNADLDSIITSNEIRRLRLKSKNKFSYTKFRYIGDSSLFGELYRDFGGINIGGGVADSFTIYKGNKIIQYTMTNIISYGKELQVSVSECGSEIIRIGSYTYFNSEENVVRTSYSFCKNAGSIKYLSSSIGRGGAEGTITVYYMIGANCGVMRIEKEEGHYTIFKR